MPGEAHETYTVTRYGVGSGQVAETPGHSFETYVRQV
jgi:hypothetical protein